MANKISDEWQETDTWETIRGFSDYRINKQGCIMSIKYGREKILRLTKTKIGYLQVTLNSYNKKYVHHLMATQYLNHIPTKLLQVNHMDGDKTNNHINNLEIVTPKQNTNHAIAIGIHKDQKGENNYSSRLKDLEVKQIKYALKYGTEVKILAKHFNVSESTIYLIKENKTWVHI